MRRAALTSLIVIALGTTATAQQRPDAAPGDPPQSPPSGAEQAPAGPPIPLRGQPPERAIALDALTDEAALTDGVRLVPARGDSDPAELAIDTAPQPRKLPLLTIEQPDVQMPAYAVRGEVRYDDVDGQGYLMTLNYFEHKAGDQVRHRAFFTKGLAATGPMQRISGSSPWRSFALPFYCERGAEARPGNRPDRIELLLVLPGKGTVHLRNLELLEFDEDNDPFAAAGAWWSGTSAGWIGGLGGAAIGLVGALIGVLASFGRGRGLVVGLINGLTVLGAAMIVLAVVAIVRSQPYAVWYPLLLIGLLCVIILPVQLPHIRRRYEQMELRRMEALDAR